MELIFENQVGGDYDILEPRYLEIMKTAFSYLGVKINYEVDVNLVDRETIHRINREYRNVDRVTDVISFAFNDDDSELSQINDPEIPHLLGEIFICVDRAIEQAAEIGNTIDRELNFLFVHGLLHLLGYDHMKEEDEKIMFPLQEKILSLVATKEQRK